MRDVPDDQFTAVLGREIPPAFRDPDEPLDLTNNLEDACATPSGKALNSFIETLVKKFSLGSGNGAMLRAMLMQIPIKDFTAMSMGVFTEEMAQGLLMILNGKSKPEGLAKMVGGLGSVVKNLKTLLGAI